MERVFCVNRTEVNKSYSRSRARRFATSRVKVAGKVVLPSVVSRSAVRFFSLVRSLARSRFTLSHVSPRTCTHLENWSEARDSSTSSLFRSFSLLLLVDITRPSRGQRKKEWSNGPNLFRSIPTHVVPYAASTQTGCDSLERKRHFAGCQKKYVYTPW